MGDSPYMVYSIPVSICTSSEEELLEEISVPCIAQYLSVCTVSMKCAIILKHFYVVESILSRGADLDILDLKLITLSGGSKTLLETATRCLSKTKNTTFSYRNSCGRYRNEIDLPLFKMLFKRGFDPDFVPLYFAIRKGREDLIELLLEYGADPCKPYNHEGVDWTPLKEAFSLSLPTIELIIKYAALLVESENEVELKRFLAHFKVEKAFRKFAKRCLAEVSLIKEHTLKSKVTLYSFIDSPGESHMFSEDPEIKRNVLNFLTSNPLPIYMPIIVKKLGRKYFLNALCELLPFRWNSASGEISLNYLCVSKILNLLCEKELINLWKALH